MRLDTERLLVRELAAADLDAVHAILDIDLRMDDCSRDDRAPGGLQWTILDYEQRRRLHQPPTANTRSRTSTPVRWSAWSGWSRR